MKQIIDGKMYNTDTAKLICCPHPTDIHGVYPYLYRTRKGVYFRVDYDRNNQYAILDEENAKKFIEKYGTADEYINAFGMPEEG